ncbi:hypothetical protein P153DRAFT_360046 [Dothidotthia symphoricarpi CBS 119687]|uniref:Uncharacterized protein n=1 Tax=Dothidotthia symphoricarpi CBS 119687 TaxID=1392245 RepID=A0A6A6A4M0_9PLEO|nr:uncharacterized protein P153DRAFT_360046 [Dothidotthia symphoricarpi CBS 119687]KAF2125708.1 hypothetical protein P153DRAFT_360046 [Dothidotthia symphoricarpi CBS 119687]
MLAIGLDLISTLLARSLSRNYIKYKRVKVEFYYIRSLALAYLLVSKLYFKIITINTCFLIFRLIKNSLIEVSYISNLSSTYNLDIALSSKVESVYYYVYILPYYR